MPTQLLRSSTTHGRIFVVRISPVKKQRNTSTSVSSLSRLIIPMVVIPWLSSGVLTSERWRTGASPASTTMHKPSAHDVGRKFDGKASECLMRDLLKTTDDVGVPGAKTEEYLAAPANASKIFKQHGKHAVLYHIPAHRRAAEHRDRDKLVLLELYVFCERQQKYQVSWSVY
eukprot:m.11157 g.11157  ORF g.11157 m.11157 type:complete len:172 (-) comp8275_c0_seq1:1892-2407(-)